eukprot:UN30594
MNELLLEQTAQLTREKETLMNDVRCVICLDKQSQYACIPCGHRCLCSDCESTITTGWASRCPICRNTVNQKVKIFM